MTSITFFLLFIPILALILLAINLIFAPHNPYKEKNSAFECGFTSFLGQNRTQFSISFFIFALLFLLFDLEILLVYPYLVSSYTNETYGLIILLIFLSALTLGFAFELGKKALSIDSRQMHKTIDNSRSIVNVIQTSLLLINGKRVKLNSTKCFGRAKRDIIGHPTASTGLSVITLGAVILGLITLFIHDIHDMLPQIYNDVIGSVLDQARSTYTDASNSIRLFENAYRGLVNYAANFQLPQPVQALSDISDEQLRSLRSFVVNLNAIMDNNSQSFRQMAQSFENANFGFGVDPYYITNSINAYDAVAETGRDLIRAIDNGDREEILKLIRLLLNNVRFAAVNLKLLLIYVSMPGLPFDLPDYFWRCDALKMDPSDIYAFDFNHFY